MRFKIYLYIASLSLGMGALSSCDEGKTIVYHPATPDPVGNVAYFSGDTQTKYELAEGESTIVIPVYRNFTEGDLELTVTVTPNENYDDYTSYYDFPPTVSFADGEEEALYTITYDFDAVPKNVYETFTLGVEEEYSNPYVLNYLTLELIKAGWSSLGMCTYTDLFAEIENEEFEIFQNDDDPYLFRIVNPYIEYNEMDGAYFLIELIQNNEFYGDFNGESYKITLDGDDLVGFQPLFMFDDESIASNFYVMYPPLLGQIWGQSLSANYCYVAEYQNILLSETSGDDSYMPGEIHLAPVYAAPDTGYWYGDTSKEENVTIIFPGFTASDVSVEIGYAGLNGDNTAVDVLISSVGVDVTSVRVGVGAGTDTESIANQIESGSLEYKEITSAGELELPFNYTEAGRYTVVAISYKGDTPRTVVGSTFAFAGVGDPSEGWTSLGYVDYTDGYMISVYGTPLTTYQVEIQEKDDTPGYYRLVNPYGAAYPYNDPGDWDDSIDSYLYVDATIPDMVTIPYSEQTLNWGQGELTCWCGAEYFQTQGYDIDTIYDYGYFGYLYNNLIFFNPQTLIAYVGTIGPLTANVIWDENDEPLEDENGYYIDPFLIDLNTLTDTPDNTRSMNTRSSLVQKNNMIGSMFNLEMDKKAKTVKTQKPTSRNEKRPRRLR